MHAFRFNVKDLTCPNFQSLYIREPVQQICEQSHALSGDLSSRSTVLVHDSHIVDSNGNVYCVS